MLGHKWGRWALVGGWMAVIFALSAQPQLPHVIPSMLASVQDVLGHFAAYAVLGGLLHWALSGMGVKRPALWALLIVLLYALSDEFHQAFVPNRHPDPFDVATDVVGAGAALLLLNLRRSLLLRRD